MPGVPHIVTQHYASCVRDFRDTFDPRIDVAAPPNGLLEARTGLATAADTAIRVARKDIERRDTLEGHVCP